MKPSSSGSVARRELRRSVARPAPHDEKAKVYVPAVGVLQIYEVYILTNITGPNPLFLNLGSYCQCKIERNYVI